MCVGDCWCSEDVEDVTLGSTATISILLPPSICKAQQDGCWATVMMQSCT
jgi:hypothetical protein